MELRLATLDDAEALREIYNLEVTTSTATFDLVPRSLEEQRAWQAERSGARAVVVALVGGAVGGFASLSPWRDRPAYATTVEDSVYVHRAHQGQGVGRALLEELLTTATAHGFHACMARIVGGPRCVHRAARRLRVRDRRHRAGGRPQVRPVARRRRSWRRLLATCSTLPCDDRLLPPPAGPDPALHPRSAAQHHRRAGRRLGSPSSAPPAPRTPSPRCGCWTSPRARRRWWRIPPRCSPATRPTCRPEERVRRERARESAAGITGYATDAAHVVVAAALAGQLVVADLVDRRRPRSCPSRAQSSTPVPTPPAPGWHGSTGAACGWSSWTTPTSARRARRGSRPGGALGGGRVRGRRGDGPVPRVLVGAGRLGPPRHAGRRHTRPALVDRGSGPSRPGAHRGRLPRRGHPERRGHGLDPPARRLADGAGLGSRRPPLPGGGRVGRPRAAPRPASPGPAPHRGARGRHHVRCDRGAVDRPRRGVGRARARGRPRGWRTDAWSSARTRTIDDGSWWVARR